MTETPPASIPRGYVANISEFSFPFINTEYEFRDFKVVRRGRPGEDSWAIVDGFGRCYQPRGKRWGYERRPSSRTTRFLKASRMPLRQALPQADRLAERHKHIWNRRLARMIARQEAAKAAKAKEGPC